MKAKVQKEMSEEVYSQRDYITIKYNTNASIDADTNLLSLFAATENFDVKKQSSLSYDYWYRRKEGAPERYKSFTAKVLQIFYCKRADSAAN